ncbi:MAG: NAD(P)-dependent oxidoreductase [Acidimicrobiales bacterium]
MRLGFVGTGRLGAPIARNLLRGGWPLTVHDAHPGAATPLLDAGAAWAASPAAAAAASDAVITCLPRPDVVAAVVAGDGGILAGFRPGATWIDMSTTGTDEVVRLAGVAHRLGVEVLEAPVTGGVHKAATGDLTVLVGGRPDVVERHRPVLERVGSRVIHLGELGQASKMKVITNYLAFVHLVAAGEALMLSARAGIDLTDAFDAIRASSGNSFVHETESQVILSGSYDIGFTIDLACKDLDLVHRLALGLGVPMELAAVVEQRFVQAKARYGADAWSPRVVQILEDDLGVRLRAPGFPASLVED